MQLNRVHVDDQAFQSATRLHARLEMMRFVQIDMLPTGKALVDIDKLSRPIPEGKGSRLFLGAQHLDAPHTLDELENVLAGHERTDSGENSRAGSGSR
jgi:hypothetical protein